MLISQSVEMTWSNRNKTYYENLGYVWTKNKDSFYVKASDLPPQSNVLITAKCDFCGKLMSLKYYDYDRRHKKNNIHKDCCKKCSPLKHKKVMMDKYGVESPMHLENVKSNVSNSLKMDFDYIKSEFAKRGYKVISKEYIDAHSLLDVVCLKHNTLNKINWNHFQRRHGIGCIKCIKEQISKENSRLWKGGITPLHNYLRKKIEPWKTDSMKCCGFKCVVSRKNFDVIHHLYGFSEILKETMDNLNIPICEEINQYTDVELKLIEGECLKLHYKYGLGVCLTEDIHKEFHSIYGQKNFTINDFKEFIKIKTGSTLEELLNEEGFNAEKDF